MTKVYLCFIFAMFLGCVSSSKKHIAVSVESVTPGTSVNIAGKAEKLSHGSLKLGDDFVDIALKSGFKLDRAVSIVNIVPSVDTAVCEEQSHILGESKSIHSQVKRISISRDLPMAQQRFALEAKLTNITYFSDYKSGSFGTNTGLMMETPRLHARAVIVLDKMGKVAYMQVVPDVTLLPDMKKAIEVANGLL